jgi:hypothetical protein
MPRPSIFVSVAAYCDPLLGFTLRSALAQAVHPERLSFGIVEQAWPGQALHFPHDGRAAMRWTRVHALEARGPCWARALAMALYQGEDWFLQVDSHTWFEPGWDERLLRWGERLRPRLPRFILSCYPNPFRMVDGQPRATLVTHRVLAHVVKTGCDFDPAHPVLMFEGVPVDSDEPVPAMHLAAGCLFSPGRIVQELPYDPGLFFHGEEQAYALRAWTHGWELLHPPGMPMYHLYTAPGEAPPRPLHWSPEHDAQRQQRSAALIEQANRRLSALLWEGADLGVYGLGRERSLADYAGFSGIHYAARRIEPRARKARFGF